MVIVLVSPVRQWLTAKSVRMRKKRSVSSSPYTVKLVFEQMCCN